jgi:hypothetical protein
MATLVSSIEAQARFYLKEPTPRFWSSDELVGIINHGIKDLWGMIVDLNQEHFLTIDTNNVSLGAGNTQLTGVPSDTFRVHLIEPLDTTSDPGQKVIFVPRDYNSPDFINARSRPAQEPMGALAIYYTLVGAGSPVGAPTVLTAPKVTSALPLRFVYVPGPTAVTTGSTVPIPGEADNALVAWTVAYARAKERDDRSPDPNWLMVYKTEKDALSVRLTPRQTQEPEVVEDFMRSWLE